MDSRSISRYRLTKFYAHLPRETEPKSLTPLGGFPPPWTMVVSLQYYLEYCTTWISPNYHPLEVSKGGLFLHMPYLCPTVSAMAGDVVESALLGGCLM